MLCTRRPLHKDRLQDLATTAILGEVPIFSKGVKILPSPLIATVITKTAQGTVLQAIFKEGESEYSIGPDVSILADAPGEISLLGLGAAVFIVGTTKPDTPKTSAQLYAEKDGAKLPMRYSYRNRVTNGSIMASLRRA